MKLSHTSIWGWGNSYVQRHLHSFSTFSPCDGHALTLRHCQKSHQDDWVRYHKNGIYVHLLGLSHTQLRVWPPDYTDTMFYLTTSITASLRPFRLTADNAEMATISAARRVWIDASPFNVLQISIYRFWRWCSKWFSSARRHTARAPKTLFVTRRNIVSCAIRREERSDW
jgi:hypothetical protein